MNARESEHSESKPNESGHRLTLEDLESSVRVPYEDLVASHDPIPRKPTTDFEDDQTKLLRQVGLGA